MGKVDRLKGVRGKVTQAYRLKAFRGSGIKELR